MKPFAIMAACAVGFLGCMAPSNSGGKVKAWEYPVSAVMLPFDGLINAVVLFDEAKAKKGDAGAALRLARDNLDWGAGRSYFEQRSRFWYGQAKELDHPLAQRPFEEWRASYTPPPPDHSSGIWLEALLPLILD